MDNEQETTELENKPPENNTPDPEQGDDLTRLVSEEVSTTDIDQETATINAEDFSLDKDEDTAQQPPATEQGKKEEPAPEPKTEPASNKKDPEKPETKKDQAMKRLFNTKTVILFYNTIARRVGQVAKQEYPEILTLSSDDQDDFSALLSSAAEEEGWSSVPAKYLLLGVIFMKGFEIYFIWNKPHLWPKNIEQKAKNDAEKASNEREQKAAEYREKARAEAEYNVSEMKETLRRQEETIRLQTEQISDLLKQFKNPEPGKAPATTVVEYEEIPDRIYRGFDMKVISFRENGTLIDPTKAGEPGFTDKGVRNGKRPKSDDELHDHWNKYYKYYKKEKKPSYE